MFIYSSCLLAVSCSLATFSAFAGVEEEALVKMIGHADIRTTRRHYIHAPLMELPEAKHIRKEAQKIEEYIKAHIAM